MTQGPAPFLKVHAWCHALLPPNRVLLVANDENLQHDRQPAAAAWVHQFVFPEASTAAMCMSALSC